MNRATLTSDSSAFLFFGRHGCANIAGGGRRRATSPKGDFRIQRETKPPPTDQGEGEISAFVVSTSDPGCESAVHQYPETNRYHYYISPDGNWIYRQASYGSRMSGGRLFKRLNGLSLKIRCQTATTSMMRSGNSLEDRKDFGKRVPYFDSREGMIEFVAWSPDSGRVLLSLICGDFNGKRERGSRTGIFTSIPGPDASS